MLPCRHNSINTARVSYSQAISYTVCKCSLTRPSFITCVLLSANYWIRLININNNIGKKPLEKFQCNLVPNVVRWPEIFHLVPEIYTMFRHSY